MFVLKQLESGRSNNFGLIRLIAASLVIFSHSFWVTGNLSSEPLRKYCGLVDFGSLSLKIFFLVSGYLITKSLFKQPTLTSFVKARILRIIPALFPAAIISVFIIGPIATTIPLSKYLSDGHIYRFVFNMSTLHGDFYNLPGLFKQNLATSVVNIPLWTLPAELFLYFFVMILGGAILLVKRNSNTLITLPLFIVIFVCWWGIPFATSLRGYIANWGLLFLGGMACYLFRQRVVLSIRIFICLMAIFIALFHFRFPFIGTALDITLIYGVLLCAYHPKLQVRAYYNTGDFSYGLYIYAFPIQQLLVTKYPAMQPAANFYLSFPLTLAAAMLSWYCVEKPALGWKDKHTSLKKLLSFR